jgi:hypothetical protein
MGRGPFDQRGWLSTLQPLWVTWLVEVLSAGFVAGVVVDEDVSVWLALLSVVSRWIRCAGFNVGDLCVVLLVQVLLA